MLETNSFALKEGGGLENLLTDSDTLLRKSRLFGIICFLFPVVCQVLLFIAQVPPEYPDLTTMTFSWLLILLMPVDLALTFVMQRFLERRMKPESFPGLTTLLYTIGITPTIYGLIIAFINSAMGAFGNLLGLVFSYTIIACIWILSPSLLERMLLRAIMDLNQSEQ